MMVIFVARHRLFAIQSVWIESIATQSGSGTLFYNHQKL